MNRSGATGLPLRQRLLVAAAFVTALGTGYVANLDDSAVAAGDGGLLATQPAGRAGVVAPNPGRAASLARGDWALPSDAALQAWGPSMPGLVERAAAARPGAAAVTARGAAAAAPPVAVSGAVAEALPPPPWRYIGRITDEGPVRALLATAQQVQVVAERDTLEGGWRVQRIDAQGVELRAAASGQPFLLAWEAP